MKILFTLAALGSLLAASASMATPVTIVALTDFHGALDPNTVKNANGIPVVTSDPAALASYIKIIKAKSSGPVLLIDAGDLFQGTLSSNVPEGAPVIELYNYLGVSAAAVGNHDFDYGPVGPNDVPLHKKEDPRGALKARISEAKFPMLAANIVDKFGNTPAYIKKSTIVSVSGLKVGIIGAASPDTPSTTKTDNLGGLMFLDPTAPVMAEATRLRQQEKVDVVVLTIHHGSGCKDNSPQAVGDLSTCLRTPGYDLLTMIEKAPVGLIDVVVAGHTHQGVAKKINSTVVLQTFSRGRHIGWAEVNHTDTGNQSRIMGFTAVCAQSVVTASGTSCDPGVVAQSTSQIVATNFLGELVRPDLGAHQIAKKALARVAPIANRALNVTVAPPGLKHGFSGETALGNLVVDALFQSVPGLDAAISNEGGLRTDIPAKPLIYNDIYNLMPFNNQITIVSLTGAEIKQLVDIGMSGRQEGYDWSGLTFEAANCQATAIWMNGQPLDLNRSYRVGTTDFLATGGSGFGALHLTPARYQILKDPAHVLREQIVAFLERWKSQHPAQNLSPTDFFDPAHPRQKILQPCVINAPGGNSH